MENSLRPENIIGKSRLQQVRAEAAISQFEEFGFSSFSPMIAELDALVGIKKNASLTYPEELALKDMKSKIRNAFGRRTSSVINAWVATQTDEDDPKIIQFPTH